MRVCCVSMRANGTAIRAIRERSGLSGRKLAEAAEIDAATLLRIEAGKSTGHPASLARIATALDVPLTAITTSDAEAVA